MLVSAGAEAGPERLDLKKAILGDLDRLAPQDENSGEQLLFLSASQIVDRVTNTSRIVNTRYYMRRSRLPRAVSHPIR
jgi:3-hydroxyacyl-CoA dehydrogenase